MEAPHAKGNTYIALHEMEKIFQEEGVDTEIIHVGNKAIRGCIACNSCAAKGKCIFDDEVNETALKFEECDGAGSGNPRLLCIRKCNLDCVSGQTFLQYAI